MNDCIPSQDDRQTYLHQSREILPFWPCYTLYHPAVGKGAMMDAKLKAIAAAARHLQAAIEALDTAELHQLAAMAAHALELLEARDNRGLSKGGKESGEPPFDG